MTKNELFEAIWNIVKNTEIDFEEQYVGDEEPNQIYFKFKNVKDDA